MQTTHDLRAFVNVSSEGAIGRCYMNQVLLKDLPNSQENQSLQRATLLKRRVQHRRFPVNLKQFLRTPFLQNTSGQLLSQVYFQFILAFKQGVAGQWTAILYLTCDYLQGNVCSCRAIARLLVAQNIFFKCTIFSAHVIMFSSSCSHISPKNS